MYSIPTEASSQVKQLLPFKSVSFKALFLTMQAPSVLTNSAYHTKSNACEEIYQYSFRCGSTIQEII